MQGQGVLSEKLRSFSLQDLTLIQNEEELLDDDTRTAATLPRAKTRSGVRTHLFLSCYIFNITWMRDCKFPEESVNKSTIKFKCKS